MSPAIEKDDGAAVPASASNNEEPMAAVDPNPAVVRSVLEDAETKIDYHLNHMKNSRRLFYRGGGKSWAHISEASNEEDDDEEDEEEVVKEKSAELKAVRGQYGDFLASRANVKVLQQNVAEAEELFYKEQATDPVSSTATDSLPPRFKMQLFNAVHYDNTEHRWEKKPFTVDFMRTFFGTIREERMDKLIKSKRSKIAKNGSWDPEGLVLTDLGRPFRCKLYFSVNDEDNLPSKFKVEYLSGVWLSKVYKGEYGQFLDWVDDAIKYVKENYNGKKVSAHRNFFAYYPSALENQKPADQSLAVFFIKVSD
ncbi:hypothetical protein ACA910_015137 [Epithemia clementina (nom. ined.)]